MVKNIKKVGTFLLCGVMICLLPACGNGDASTQEDSEIETSDVAVNTEEETESIAEEALEDDNMIDLTTMSSTMVYAEVYDMLINPEDYIGKTVKMEGQFVILEDGTGENIYTACLIYDATACCAQGVEFILGGETTYPEDYPELYEEIIVTGVFETYDENGTQYIHLVDCVQE